MNTLKNIAIVAFLSMAIMGCKTEAKPEVKTVENKELTVAKQELDPNATYAKAEFGIEGMTCAMGCAKTIEKKIANMDGVKSAKVDFEKELAMVEYDEAKVTPNSLEEAVAKAGDAYKVKDMKTVEHFSNEKEACKEDCTKACCADKTKAEKMACAENCTKACCAEKKKA
ncbi:heavy-metal-associated domain-containing protein [Psychroserpens sp. XS_ASV72]|uniref:heavy-metal-associated domain-containing protein n=1 Tax=Psychroserpens sp. XS_ASV72 TaxID=3241293 RepID=UPI0035148397